MTLLELVKVILHHVDLANLLRDSMLHLVALRFELCGVVAKKIKLMSDKVEKIGESR